MPTIQFSGGLASGLDSKAIIDALISAQRQPATILEGRIADRTNQITAFKGLTAVLLSLQIETDNLAKPGTFGGLTVTSSDEEIATATAESGASPGNVTFTVDSVAQAEIRVSQGFASTGASVGTGSISIGVGSDAPTSIAIDSAHATLAGLRDAINAADVGVSASIVNTGTGAAPYRLMLTGGATGAENTIDFSSSLTGGTAPAFDPDTSLLQAAQNAKITFGGSAGGGTPLSVESATNVFDNVLDGLSVTVQKTSAEAVTLEVARDVESVATGVKNFVSRYNGVLDFLKTQLSYDPETKKSGVLFTDPTLLSVDQSLRRMVVSRVPGVTGAFRALSSIGITSSAGGKLTIDEEKLNAAIEEDPESVRQLFAATGRTTDADVSFLALGDRTQATSNQRDARLAADGYAIRVTRAAERAEIAGGNVADPAMTPLVISSANNVAQVRVNGVLSGQIVLTEGSYTSGDDAAAMLQAKLNGDPALSANPVEVSYVDGGGGQGHFVVASDRYGESATIELVGAAGDAFAGAFGFASGQIGAVTHGVDVAGTINGEEAHGSGQTLIGGPASPDDPDAFKTLGVRILVTLSPAELALQGADQGAVHVTAGLGSLLSHQLARLTDSAGGTLDTRQESLGKQIDGLNEQIDRIDARLAVRRRSLELLFGRLEQSIQELQSQGSFLGSQLAGLGSGSQG